MMTLRDLGWLACVALPLAFASVQDPASDAERDEHIALGRLTFDNSCRMCHEPELVRQQRLTPAQWDAELDKMISWGATLTPEERPDLRAYLITEFGTANRPVARTLDKPIPKPPASTLVAAARPGSSERGSTLYAQHCANCHGPDGRGGEPGQNLVEQEILLRPDEFRAIIASGRHKMPAFAEVLEPEAIEDLRAWLLTLTYEPTANP
jgi:ubiquinol-cytochrome c reductase cytochrome c subunit